RQLLSTGSLTAAEVTQIVDAAAAVSLPSQTIAVVDRDGNILALYGQVPSAANQNASPTDLSALVQEDSNGNLVGGALVENTTTKYSLIQAVAKARTAAAFESTQDAFTSRTARFIVTDDFPEPITDTESGPLLGVEFSAALGTDVLAPGLSTGLAAGLSGNPGGVPLFLNGQPVGAIGVAGDGSDVAARPDLVPQAVPGLPFDQQSPAYKSDPTGAYYQGTEEYDFDEAVAQAGAQGYMAPSAIQSTNILVNGLTLPFVAEGPATGVPAGMTGLIGINGPITTPRAFFKYDPLGKTSAAPIPTPVSPYPAAEIPLTTGGFEPGSVRNNSPAAGGLGFDPGQVLTDDATQIPIEEPDGSAGFETGNFGFLQGQPARDGSGEYLTVSDVTQIVSQAVTEALSIRGAIRVPFDVPARIYVSVTDTQGNVLADFKMQDATNFSNDIAVQKARTAAYFSSDTAAFSSRAIGFIAAAALPPSQDDGVTGPLYQLQESLALPFNQIGFLPQVTNPNGKVVPNPLGNGITIFPGGAPLYIDGHLVGAVGISGDGVDQDDLMAYDASVGFQAPNNIRDNNLSQSQIVAFLEQKINQLGFTPAPGDPHFTFPTITFLQSQVGFDDPDNPNIDGILITPDDTIIDRILRRLEAKGIDSVNLPYQKFPRNPQL
ncbi:MAG TPA: heme-binding protein, partial [Tepidisphaeraceae bacterium]|nr:heme-binding protein [Tepidisphaeraceae bacterium]